MGLGDAWGHLRTLGVKGTLGDNWGGTWGAFGEPTHGIQTFRLTLGDTWGGFRGRLGTLEDTWG